jgi:hypothetical protein
MIHVPSNAKQKYVFGFCVFADVIEDNLLFVFRQYWFPMLCSPDSVNQNSNIAHSAVFKFIKLSRSDLRGLHHWFITKF